MIGPADSSKVAYNLAEAAVATTLSITTLRMEIHRGRLKAKKYGRSYLITAQALRDFVDSLPDAD